MNPTHSATTPTAYIRVPFTSELDKRRITAMVRRSGLHDKVRVIFTWPPTLSNLLKPARDKPRCPEHCITCNNSSRPNQCQVKACVYRITCNLCAAVYVGETGRSMATRLHEHRTRPSSLVFQHYATSHHTTPNDYTWCVLHPALSHTNHRRRVESIFIHLSKQAGLTLMNGCQGYPLHIPICF